MNSQKNKNLKKDSAKKRFDISSYISPLDTVTTTDADEILGSVLPLVQSSHSPLFIFTILNFVFSNIFGINDPNYSLRLLTSIMIWNFFAEGTMNGMGSILSKASILTKIYLPKWTIVVSSTLHIFFTYLLNIIIIILFFAWSAYPQAQTIFVVVFAPLRPILLKIYLLFFSKKALNISSCPA